MNSPMRRVLPIAALMFAGAIFTLGVPEARELREITAIPSPNTPLPHGAVRPDPLVPVDRAVIEKAVNDLVGAWNGQGLSELIAEDFANSAQLLLVIAKDVPRDATMRVLAVQGIATLDQYVQTMQTGQDRVSIVTATVKTAIEFNDPIQGFQRLEGVNEFNFRVTEETR